MPGSSAELLVKAKQGYPQSNIYSVLDRFVVHTHMQSSFQMYSNLLAVKKNLNHPISLY